MRIRKIDHVGVVVRDLAATKEFFLDFGLETLGSVELEGAWLDKIVGLENVRSEIVMLGTPDGQATIELSKFHSPTGETGVEQSPANALGIRHIAFQVEGIEDIVAKLNQKGIKTFGEIQNYKNIYKLCYFRGPEGIILEIAERIK